NLRQAVLGLQPVLRTEPPAPFLVLAEYQERRSEPRRSPAASAPRRPHGEHRPGRAARLQGPLYYPPDEVGRNVKDWDGTPITSGPPSVAGAPASARPPTRRADRATAYGQSGEPPP